MVKRYVNRPSCYSDRNPIKHICNVIVRYNFINVEDRKLMIHFILLTNFRLNLIHISFKKWNTLTDCDLFFVLICSSMVNLRLISRSVQLKLQCFKYSQSVFSKNNHALLKKHCSNVFQSIFAFEIQVFKKMYKQKCVR